MFQSLPSYTSMLPTREQLKEKTAINLMAERNSWMLFFHLNLERDSKYDSPRIILYRINIFVQVAHSCLPSFSTTSDRNSVVGRCHFKKEYGMPAITQTCTQE